MKIKLGLFGSTGKMGKAVEQMLPLIKSKNEIIPFLAIGNESSNLFAVTASHIFSVEDVVLSDVDVWIDFSSPEGLKNLIKATAKFNTPLVSGSTGLTVKDFKNLKTSALKRKIFWASNLSPGLWAFRQALKGLASISKFDFAIDETHHTQKKDKPSGTAKTLHNDLEAILNKKISAPVSHRLGGVFGVHNVMAASSNETISMQHQALNRTVFAEGALMAADWLNSKKVGLYSMDDMLLNKLKQKKDLLK